MSAQSLSLSFPATAFVPVDPKNLQIGDVVQIVWTYRPQLGIPPYVKGGVVTEVFLSDEVSGQGPFCGDSSYVATDQWVCYLSCVCEWFVLS